MLSTYVTLSVILGFLCTEFTGLLAGGLVSAGYLAFYFNEPYRIVSTLLIAVVITLLMKLLAYWLILYGRRRFMLSVLLSLLAVYIVENCYYYVASIPVDLRIIGFIVPGLIANDMERQGILKTLGALAGVTIALRLLTFLFA